MRRSTRQKEGGSRTGGLPNKDGNEFRGVKDTFGDRNPEYRTLQVPRQTEEVSRGCADGAKIKQGNTEQRPKKIGGGDLLEKQTRYLRRRVFCNRP